MLSVLVGEAARPSVRNTMRIAYAGDSNSANNSVTKSTVVKAGRITPTPGTPTPTFTVGPPPPTPTATQSVAPTSTRTPTPAATDLLITKTIGGSFAVGANGLYNIAVSNVGSASTNNVITVTDTLPNGLSFVSGTGAGWTCAAAGQIVTCTTSQPLDGASSTTIALTVAVGAAAYPSVTNTVTVSYAGDTNATNNTAHKPTTIKQGSGSVATATTASGTPLPTSTATPTKTATPAGPAAATDLSMSKTTGGSFTVGTTGTYFLTVSNIGAASTNAIITVTDPLPNGLSFVSASGSGWTCSAGGPTVSCTNPNPLPAGSSSSITLVVGIGSAASPTVTNSATVSYAGNTNASNNTAHKPTTVRS